MDVQSFTAALLAVFEGEKFVAYQDSGGIWTIGIGHTGGVTPGMTSTHEQNVRWLASDCGALFALVGGLGAIEAAALVSFGYNCGIGNLRKALLNRQWILDPVHTTDRRGTVLAGLVARRRLEGLLCGVTGQ